MGLESLFRAQSREQIDNFYSNYQSMRGSNTNPTIADHDENEYNEELPTRHPGKVKQED